MVPRRDIHSWGKWLTRYPMRSHSAGGREGGRCQRNRVIHILQTTHTRSHLCPLTLQQIEYLFIICSSPAAHKDCCLWGAYGAGQIVYSCVNVFRSEWKLGNVQQAAASLTLQQGASGYCKQTHPRAHTHTHNRTLAPISFTHGRRSVALGYFQDGYRCHLIEKGRRRGMLHS